MKFSEFSRLVASVTYKPGEKILIAETSIGNYGLTELQLVRTVPDSKKPGQTIEIHHGICFSDYKIEVLTPDLAREIIYNHLRSSEIHECQEFLKFDGEQYLDPHA